MESSKHKEDIITVVEYKTWSWFWTCQKFDSFQSHDRKGWYASSTWPIGSVSWSGHFVIVEHKWGYSSYNLTIIPSLSLFLSLIIDWRMAEKSFRFRLNSKNLPRQACSRKAISVTLFSSLGFCFIDLISCIVLVTIANFCEPSASPLRIFSIKRIMSSISSFSA